METAVAHDLDYDVPPAATEQRRGPRLASVNPVSPGRKAPPVQPSLFAFRDSQKVIPLTIASTPPRLRQADGQRAPRKRAVSEAQSAFDFDAPPAPNVLTHSSDKNTHLAAAPVSLRAMAALFDAGLAGCLTGLFLTTVRLTLGHLPASNAACIAYACGGVLFFLLYKLLFCLYGRPTFGLQGARLRVVSFNGGPPRRSQLIIRLMAGCVSVISAGMGLLWPLADPDKLSWHDHISQTFLTSEGGR